MSIDTTTYVLASLGTNTLKKVAFKINDDLHQVVNVVNMYREIYIHDMAYLLFSEFCTALEIQDKKLFYQAVSGGNGNLVTDPLGYDGTSHSAFFISTMHHNFPIDLVDLSTRTTIDPIHCYMINGDLFLPFDIIINNNKISCEDSIHSYLYQFISEKHKELRSATREDGSFDEAKFTKYLDVMRSEDNTLKAFLNEQEDGVEFEYMGNVFTKNIPIDDPLVIHELLTI